MHKLERKKLQVLVRTQAPTAITLTRVKPDKETTRRGPTGLVLEEMRLTSEEGSCLEKER